MWQSKTLCRWHQSSRCNSRPLRQLLVCCCLLSFVRGTRNVVKSCTWSLTTRISSGYLCGYLSISFLAIRNLDWNLCWWFATMYRPRPTFVHTFDQSHRILECSTWKGICQVSWNLWPKNSSNWKWQLWFHEKIVVLSFDRKSEKTHE